MKLADLLKPNSRTAPERRARVRWEEPDTAVYAIGDVHGCLDQLIALERRIAADAEGLPGRKLIIMLGDYVDRGPASSQVIDHLRAPPQAGFQRICLAGNHEMLMLAYLEGRCGLAQWLTLGAAATLVSYGIDHERLQTVYQQADHIDMIIRKTIPASHVAFLRSLPVLVETRTTVFVHAGFRPDIPLDQQSDESLASLRSAFYDRAHLLKRIVVHGHTPVSEPQLDGRRLNIDTGACLGGPLTAVRIWRGKGRFLHSPPVASDAPAHVTRSP